MSDIIKCDTGSLATDTNDVAGYVKKVNASIATLESLFKRLDTMWDGDASEAYKVKFLGYLKQLQAIAKEYEGVNKYENNAYTEYDKNERAVAGLISSISV